MFWHSFDLALTRFSGRPAPAMPGANMVTREAYSHEVISFGFWFGDDKPNGLPKPAFYSYTAPEPAGLADEPLPSPGSWIEANNSHMALLMYDDVRKVEDPRAAILEFFEATYQAGARRAGWDVASFRLGAAA